MDSHTRIDNAAALIMAQMVGSTPPVKRDAEQMAKEAYILATALEQRRSKLTKDPVFTWETTPPSPPADDSYSHLIGMEENTARGYLKERGITMRVVNRNGAPSIGTSDYRTDRLNVSVRTAEQGGHSYITNVRGLG